jgi:Tfp pilus assembly protein PilF
VHKQTAAPDDWIPALTNRIYNILRPGDTLRVTDIGRAAVLWTDNSIIRLGPAAKLQVPLAEEQGVFARLLRGVGHFFHRDKPGVLDVETPRTSLTVKGTEFVVEVAEDGSAKVGVIEGVVLMSNKVSKPLLLRKGEAGTATPSGEFQGPVAIDATNILQWCLYYPAVLDIDDLRLTAQERGILSNSLAAFEVGDLLLALAEYPREREPESDDERVYRAALWLSSGYVVECEAILDRVSAAGTADGRIGRLIEAQRQLIAAVRHQPWRRSRAPELPTEWVAESYYQQSRAEPTSTAEISEWEQNFYGPARFDDQNLRNALKAAQAATSAAPAWDSAWIRQAELEFSFGRINAARQALRQALRPALRNAQAFALEGFLAAARGNWNEAESAFRRATDLDGGLANGWLGLGLVEMHRGKIEEGRKKLELAAAVEPRRSLLRSYLGKAWANASQDQKAKAELGLAAGLDPKDPTPWLYSAVLNQELNQINSGVEDLEKSIELNDNRSLFRSKLLLDQDRAVRSASLASIYRDAGMIDVSVREAARAVNDDWVNYSAHQFLAESYDALRDPTRFNLRYETVWFNELLLANLLSPAGVPALSPNISQQEYSRMFEKDRLGLATTTDARTDGQFREIASQYGAYRDFSYSLDLDWQHNNGVRTNNDLTRTEWYSQLKFQLTPDDSLLFLTKYEDYSSGDNFQYFDASLTTITTNSYTREIRTNTAFRPYFRYDETQEPIAVAAYHREWSPGVHTLALAGRLVNDQTLSDKNVSVPVLNFNTSRVLQSVANTDFDVSYRSQLEIYIGEINQIVQSDRNTLILGGRFQSGRIETQNWLTNTTLFSGFFPTTNTATTEDVQRWSAYGYDTLEAISGQLWLTAGLAYDRLKYPSNFRQIPISSGETTTDSIGPKGALVWNPIPAVTFRGAYSRSLGGVSLDESYRLEPSQLAGFSQSYRSLISESVVGSVSAPTFQILGAALDIKLATHTYFGVSGETLSSDVDRLLGVYYYTNSLHAAYVASTPEELRYREHSASLVLNQLVSEQWSLGASYKFTRSELDQNLTDVSTSALSSAREFDRSDLHTINLYVLFNDPSGFFARAECNWYVQDNFMRTNGVTVKLGGDQFPQANFWVGWRFRRKLGDISVGLLNANGTDYSLNPLNAYSELPRERTMQVRLRLRF